MPSAKGILKTAKALVGIGNLKKPADWPVNPYSEELKKVGGFKDSIVSTATGRENRSMTLLINSKIVNMRDQQVFNYLKTKGVVFKVDNDGTIVIVLENPTVCR